MTLLPPFLILFDTTALLASNTRQWQEFSRLGRCFVPTAVLEHLQALANQGVDPTTEAIAREFARFYPTSGWEKTDAIADHPSLKPAEGSSLSQRARLVLEVLECSLGLALRHPEALVVLVANEQTMLQRLATLKTTNLCGTPLAGLVQWSRTQRRPDPVNKQLQVMRSLTPPIANAAPPCGATTLADSPRSSRRNAATMATARPLVPPAAKAERTAPPRIDTGLRTPPKGTAPGTVAKARASHSVRSAGRSAHSTQSRRGVPVKKLAMDILTWALVIFVISLIWRLVHPTSFNQFWRQVPIIGRTLK
jgi:hypothetical protein